MAFHIGQKVVCIDASPSYIKHPLVHGCIYTISGFDVETNPAVVGILIEEWNHPPALCHKGPLGFRPERFRPIVERKTSIDVFTKMLKPEKADA